MKRLFAFIFATSLCVLGWAQGDVSFNRVHINPQSSCNIGCSTQGVSAAFAGTVNGQSVLAGGNNYPTTPAHEGGKKVYYDTVMANQGGWWKPVGRLPLPVAYGASAQVPEGLVCLGGQDSTGVAIRSVYLISSVMIADCVSTATQPGMTGTGQTIITALPDLPEPMAECAAAYYDGYIYIAGGHTSHFYRLAYPKGQWEVLPDVPGPQRVQPSAVVQNDALGPQFVLLGGYDPTAKDLSKHSYIYNIRTRVWRTTSPMPYGLAGAQATAIGASSVMLIGGVNDTIFTKAIRGEYGDDYMLHPKEWYKFREKPLVYNLISDAWTELPGSKALARAGAMLVPSCNSDTANTWTLIGGELKPGVRSCNVNDVAVTAERSFGWINWTVLVLYLAAMLALGLFFMRRGGDAEDFFKGGGRIPWWAAGISIYATMLSAITYMSIPAKAYATDWTYYPMLITILIVSFPVIKYYLPFFRQLKVASAYQYLEERFNAATRLMASALFIAFMVARTALVLYLPSLALSAVTGISVEMSIVLMGVVTIIYCTMGGVEAVIWGDVIQGLLLVGGAIFSCFYLWGNTEGGFSGAWQLAIDNDKMRLFDWSFDYRSATFWVIILGGLANNLVSYTSDQTVIQRYMTTKDERSAAHSILLNGLMSVFISIAFYIIGTGLFTFYHTHPTAMDITMAKTDAIFPFFMMSQMPAGVAGLLIAAIFAATMSTIASNINSVATAFSVDFFQRFRPSVDSQHLLRVARYACMVCGMLGVGIALLMCTWNILSLLDYFNTILGLLTSGLCGLFVMGRFFPRIGGKAALAGFVIGTGVVFMVSAWTDVSFLLFSVIGITVSVLVALLLSLFSPKRPTNP